MTTPAGMHRFAMNYADAAFQVAQQPRLLGPAYFLAAHSIELSLKAFLLAAWQALWRGSSNRSRPSRAHEGSEASKDWAGGRD